MSGIGRFTGKDPIGYPGYNYVKNLPTIYVDIYGYEEQLFNTSDNYICGESISNYSENNLGINDNTSAININGTIYYNTKEDKQKDIEAAKDLQEYGAWILTGAAVVGVFSTKNPVLTPLATGIGLVGAASVAIGYSCQRKVESISIFEIDID